MLSFPYGLGHIVYDSPKKRVINLERLPEEEDVRILAPSKAWVETLQKLSENPRRAASRVAKRHSH